MAGTYHVEGAEHQTRRNGMAESLGPFEGANVRIARKIIRGLGPTEVGWEVIQRKGR